ncbi:MAG: hypothetical protein ABW318_22350 [Vicinamibacterales bacterium]
MDRLQLEERAAAAQQQLFDPVFQEAVTALRRTLVERFLALPVGDPKVVEVHLMTKALDELVGELRSYVAATKVPDQGKRRGNDAFRGTPRI